MTDAPEAMSRHDLEAKVVKHSWEDEGFRKEFLADPAGAFVKYLNVPAGNLPKIVVHEEEPGSWHIVLPAKPAEAQELSDEDLERVAGGTTPTITVVSAVSSLLLTASQAVSENKGGW